MAETKRCPRAKSDMTPCVLKDGDLALTDDFHCAGCDKLFVSMAEIRRVHQQFTADTPAEGRATQYD